MHCTGRRYGTISAARPGARRETLETYTNRLKQLEERILPVSLRVLRNLLAIQAGREIRGHGSTGSRK